jgi:hypothetical protein
MRGSLPGQPSPPGQPVKTSEGPRSGYLFPMSMESLIAWSRDDDAVVHRQHLFR